MKALDEDFNRKLSALDEEASTERNEIAVAHARHKKDMNDVIMAMQTQFAELEGDLRQVSVSSQILNAIGHGHAVGRRTLRPDSVSKLCMKRAAASDQSMARLLLQDYEAAREEIKNKNTEDFNVMKITLESNIDDLEKKFEVSHDAYLMQTSEHMATFTALTKTDAQAARLIDMRLRKLQRLQVLIRSVVT